MTRPVWDKPKPQTPEQIQAAFDTAAEWERKSRVQVREYLPGWFDVTLDGRRISPRHWRKESEAVEWAWNYKCLTGTL